MPMRSLPPLLTILLLAAGCTHAPIVRFRDAGGGASIESAEFTADGKYILLSTRCGETDSRTRDWYLHCVDLGCKRKLNDHLSAVGRWTDADVWPSPITGELAIVREEAIEIFDIAQDRVIHRVDRDVWRSGCLLVESGKHEEFAALLIAPAAGEDRRQFWSYYLLRRNGRKLSEDELKRAAGRRVIVPRDGTASLPTPDGAATLELRALPVPPPFYAGNLLDRYGDALGLTDAKMGGHVVVEPKNSQATRAAGRVVQFPTDALCAGWGFVIRGWEEFCRSRIGD